MRRTSHCGRDLIDPGGSTHESRLRKRPGDASGGFFDFARRFFRRANLMPTEHLDSLAALSAKCQVREECQPNNQQSHGQREQPGIFSPWGRFLCGREFGRLVVSLRFAHAWHECWPIS